MNKKCLGCGINLQTDSKNREGYVIGEHDICERCHRLKNYGDYQVSTKNNSDFINILNQINQTKSLVVLVVDLFDLKENYDLFINHLQNPILLVMTKRDLLPRSYSDTKLLSYLDLKCVDKVIVSSKKNYNFDSLIEKIRKYQTDKQVYVVGYTNDGKSTLINKLIYNYSDTLPTITTSHLPSTTLNNIEIKLDDDLVMIDTPGLLDEGNIENNFDLIKTVLPQKEIKPLTYQIKVKQTFLINDLVRLDIDRDNNITFYINNSLKMERLYKENTHLKNLEKHVIDVQNNSDIVISGLGFIRIKKACQITIYTLKGVKVFTRKALIS
ncbi:MAG: 50S ribosome-binding GTPase [Bacilli bacterium]|nr:50S ribosome-binding GTPase [Bacilli bacterium]MDD4808707.1 50S ribosome-binding GTPase [Bacilli bacterium]